MEQTEIDNIREVLDKDPNVSEEIKKIFSIMSIQLEYLMNSQSSTSKIVASLDDCVAEMCEEVEGFRDTFRREVLNSFNLHNPIESSLDYQKDQGLLERPLDKNNPQLDLDESIVFCFADPELNKVYDKICKLVKQFSPDIDGVDVYQFLARHM